MEWTPERDGALAERWATGLPTRHIAAELSALFGVRLTKNAVIGRAHRTLLPARPGAIRPRNPNAPPRDLHKRAAPPALDALVPMAAAWIIDVPDVDHVVIVRPPMSHDAPLPPIVIRPRPPRRADNSGCSFPLGVPGKPGFRFCDADLCADRRCDYCEIHRREAWRKADGKPMPREGWVEKKGTADAKARVFGA